MKIIRLLTLAILSGTSHAEELKPLQYLVDSLRVGSSGGSVVATRGGLEWPTILESESAVVSVGHSHGYDAGVTIEWTGDSWKHFLSANGFKNDLTLEALAGVDPSLRKLLRPDHVTYARTLELPRLGLVILHAHVVTEAGKNPKLDLIIGHFTRHFIAPEHKKAEQGDAVQSATAADSKADGKEKPKPETEGRSQ